MNRRAFLRAAALAPPALAAARAQGPDRHRGRVMTVLGPIDPSDLGSTLPHEHVLVDFVGADRIEPGRYDPDAVFEVARPHLERIRRLGCRTLVDCTPAYLGRDPALLARLARATGLHILTCTGYYAAGGGRYLPAFARTESVDALAGRWAWEWTDGIDGTGIRPGLIKIGVDAGPLPEPARNLVRAAARAHLRTGLTIAAHTGDGVAANQQLEILRDEGVDPSAWIWVHAQSEGDPSIAAEVADRGAWVEFDGIGPKTIERHVDLVRALERRGRLDRVLISQDAGWYHVGEPGGGAFRPFDTLFTEFLPALERAGLDASARRRLTVDNPRAAFTVAVRARG